MSECKLLGIPTLDEAEIKGWWKNGENKTMITCGIEDLTGERFGRLVVIKRRRRKI